MVKAPRAIGSWRLESTPASGSNEYVWRKQLHNGRVADLMATGPGLHNGDGWWVHGEVFKRAEGQSEGGFARGSDTLSLVSKTDWFVTDNVTEDDALRAAERFMREHRKMANADDMNTEKFRGGGGYGVGDAFKDLGF